MNIICNCMVAFAMLFTPSHIFAQLSAWHTAQPLTPNASVDAQGLAWYGYNSLDLRCDTSAGDCSWLITAQMGIGNGTANMYDLWIRDPAGSATNLVVSQTTIAGSTFSNPVTIQENNSNGVISRIRASSATQVPSSLTTPYFMHSFVLTQQGLQALGALHLIAASEFGFWGTGPGTDPGYLTRPTAIDDNPIMQNFFLYQEWPNAVINITNIPEPTSLCLLACGLVLIVKNNRRSRH